jgi:membrane protease YdiL (CAAX protease family)
VGAAAMSGLQWGWVAWRTGSIRWTTVSHVLFDFSGLGARLYLDR